MDMSLFRPEAIEQLERPEQIGRVLQLVRTPYRTMLAMACAVLVAAMVASFAIRVPVTITAQGVILYQTATLEHTIAAQHEGVIAAIRVKPGDAVARGDIVAVVAQPTLESELRLAQDENAAAHRRLADVENLQRTSLQTLGPLHQHIAAEAADSIARLDRRRIELEQLASDSQRLRASGHATVDRTLQVRAQLNETVDAIATKRSGLLNLQVDWAEKMNGFARELSDLRERVAQTDRQVQRLQAQLAQASVIRANQAGTVSELKLAPGDLVRFNTPVIGLLPKGVTDADTLIAIAFVPATEGKRVNTGDRAFVDPSSVRRDVFGQVRGRVTSVSDGPATPELLRSMVRNEDLARKLTEGGPVFVTSIAMERNDATPSGYAWTSSRGPDGRLTAGTTTRTEIETERVRLAGLLVPALRHVLRGEGIH